MSNAWYEQGRVARLLSTETISRREFTEFFKKVSDLHGEANVDRRMVATDWEILRYESFADPSDEYYEALWLGFSAWEAFVNTIPVGSSAVPKYLISMQNVFSPVLKGMVDGTKDVTFLNNLYLKNFEKFLFPEHPYTAEGHFNYSVIDQLEILNGECETRFDFIGIQSPHALGLGVKEVESLLGCVSVNGVFFMTEIAQFRSIYKDSSKIHQFKINDVSRYIKDRDDFEAFHLPVGGGNVIARKTK